MVILVKFLGIKKKNDYLSNLQDFYTEEIKTAQKKRAVVPGEETLTARRRRKKKITYSVLYTT